MINQRPWQRKTKFSECSILEITELTKRLRLKAAVAAENRLESLKEECESLLVKKIQSEKRLVQAQTKLDTAIQTGVLTEQEINQWKHHVTGCKSEEEFYRDLPDDESKEYIRYIGVIFFGTIKRDFYKSWYQYYATVAERNRGLAVIWKFEANKSDEELANIAEQVKRVEAMEIELARLIRWNADNLVSSGHQSQPALGAQPHAPLETHVQFEQNILDQL